MNIIPKALFFLYLIFNNVMSLAGTLAKDCNISEIDIDNALNLIKNNNLSINTISTNIENSYLQKGLYLLGMTRSPGNFNNMEQLSVINYIGKKYMLSIQQIRQQVIEVLRYDNFEIEKIFDLLDYESLKYNDKIYILYTLNPATTKSANDVIKFILTDLMQNNQIPEYDLKFIISMFKHNLSDNIILAQLRHLLYNNRLNEANILKQFLKSHDAKETVHFLITFYKYNNYRKSKKNKPPIQNELLLQDEYIDLIALNESTNNIDKSHAILSHYQYNTFLPEKWLHHRALLARTITRSDIQDKFNIAYNILNPDYGNKTKRVDYITQQWLLGYIAYLGQDYVKAIHHFNEYTVYVKYAANQSKGYYWLGLALRQNNNIDEARVAFSNASAFTFTLYGQLAAEELHYDAHEFTKNKLKQYTEMSNIEDESLCNNPLFIAGYMSYLGYGNDTYDYLTTFFDNTSDAVSLANALRILQQDTEPSIYRRLGNQALKYNVGLPETSFPSIDLVKNHLIKAIIKQESNFSKSAISYKGARGLMQVMPQTAKEIARQLGVKYDVYRLLTDEAYNLTFGQHYIKQLLNKYDNNKILTLAAYNAGPGSVNKWIRENGDPRTFKSDAEIALWIESIPFSQTRDYVVKIMGTEMVYSAIEANK